MDINKELCGKLGIHWHEYAWSEELGDLACLKCFSTKSNPNFKADPRLVLQEMEKLRKLDDFLIHLWDTVTTLEAMKKMSDLIAFDETGKLAHLAYDWLPE